MATDAWCSECYLLQGWVGIKGLPSAVVILQTSGRIMRDRDASEDRLVEAARSADRGSRGSQGSEKLEGWLVAYWTLAGLSVAILRCQPLLRCAVIENRCRNTREEQRTRSAPR